MELTIGQYELIYNSFSLGTAAFFAATLFFWLGLPQVSKKYKTALIVTGLVTFIAGYHYLRIFQSFGEAYTAVNGVVTSTGVAFNVAYRYVDWILTVPLLLIELILVMGLSRAETISKSVKLGGAAALMIILGYPGEVSAGGIDSTRFIFGALSMIPFLYIVVSLYSGLSDSLSKQPESARGLISTARWVLILSWFFYPIVYFAPFVISLEGGSTTAVIEIGYTIADIVSKVIFGVLIFNIAVRKSETEVA